MRTPAAAAPSRIATSLLRAAAALALLTVGASPSSATNIGDAGVSVDVRLARVEARRAIIAFITITSPSGVPMDAIARVRAQEGASASRLEVIPVFSNGSVSFSTAVAPDSARHVAVQVDVEGQLHYSTDLSQGFEASASEIFADDLPPWRRPAPRPPTIPQPGDVLRLERPALR